MSLFGIIIVSILILVVIYSLLPPRIYVIGNIVIDTHRKLKNKKCHICSEALSNDNRSRWGIYVQHKGEECIADVCLHCMEILERSWKYYTKNGENITLTLPEQQVLSEIEVEMRKEGVWRDYPLLRSIESKRDTEECELAIED
jgi:hypothetical protein